MFRRLLSAAAIAAVSVVGLAAPSEALASNTPDAGSPSFNRVVNTVAKYGSVVYVGGAFTRVTDARGTYVRHGAAAFNVETGRVLAWNPNVKGTVNRLLVTREGVYIGGEFTAVKGKVRRNLARVALGGKGALARAFRPRTNGPVNALAVGPKYVFIGGDFTKINNKPRARLASVVRSGAFPLTKWAPKADDAVLDLVRTKAGIFIAGEFRKLNTRPGYQRLALVHGGTGKLIRSFNPDTKFIVMDIAVTKGRVYAGIGGPNGGATMAIRRSDSATVWQRRFDGDVQALLIFAGQVYVGGHFNNVCTTENTNTAGDCLDGSDVRRRGATLSGAGVLTGWDPAGNSELGITALVAAKRKVVAGGAFTTMNDGAVSARRMAVFSNVA